jgi:hypothetical protein
MWNYARAGFLALAVMLAGVPAAVADAEFERTKQLAEQGDALAQYFLGVMYNNGAGVPQDDAEAARWYRLAAEQANAYAQFNLGIMYSNGAGVPQDDAEAVRWFRLAAEQGHAKARFSLGIMYNNGRGVPQDKVLAHMWFNLASAAGNDLGTENRDAITRIMSPAEIAEAQKLAREWFAKHN